MMILWQTQAGRYHAMRTCSGGCTPRTSTKATLTEDEHRTAREHGKLCRCAWNYRATR